LTGETTIRPSPPYLWGGDVLADATNPTAHHITTARAGQGVGTTQGMSKRGS
jgi:hypothetical protein